MHINASVKIKMHVPPDFDISDDIIPVLLPFYRSGKGHMSNIVAPGCTLPVAALSSRRVFRFASHQDGSLFPLAFGYYLCQFA